MQAQPGKTVSTADATPGLTEDQVAHFKTHGYVNSIDVLTPDQMGIARRKFEAFERAGQEQHGEQWLDTAFQPWSERSHPLWHWFQAVATHPTIIAAASSILGPNVLIRNADVFIKEPQDVTQIQWHVDTTASFDHAQHMITAWLGVTESTEANGCMEFVPGSHRWNLPLDAHDKHSLSLAHHEWKNFDKGERAANIMRPGQLSFHNFRTLHRSGSNHTDDRRFGFVIRFVAPQATPEFAESGQGFLVAGENEPQGFSLTRTFPVCWMRGQRSQMG